MFLSTQKKFSPAGEARCGHSPAQIDPFVFYLVSHCLKRAGNLAPGLPLDHAANAKPINYNPIYMNQHDQIIVWMNLPTR